MQPIQSAIESLQANGACPRIHVDVTHADAACPDFVVEKWKQRLIIDLDPQYPLELEFTEVGVEANLSFGGFVTRCVFPWAAIYVVSERGSSRGQVFEANVPKSLRAQLAPNAVDPELTKVNDKERGRGSSRRKRRRPKKEEPVFVGLAAVEDSPAEEAPAEDGPAEDGPAEGGPVEDSSVEDSAAENQAEAPTDQREVKSRRAAFTVIDGGE